MVTTVLSDIESGSEILGNAQTLATHTSDFLANIDPIALAFTVAVYVGTIIFTVVGFLILTKVLIYINHHASKGYLVRVSTQRRETILSMLDNLIKYVMGFIGIFATLIAIGFDKTTLLASAGAASLIIGLAAQELISDFINGFFTVVEGYYDVGDYIVVNGHTGVVETLGIKSTILRTDMGEQIIIPNSLIAEIVNYNRGEHHLFLTVSTAYEADLDKVEHLINDELLQNIVKNSPATDAKYLGVAALNASSVDHRLKVSCRPDDRFQTERDVYGETKRLFDNNGIEIPYNKVTVYNG